MKTLFAVALVSFFCSISMAVECEKVLKEMRLVEVELTPVATEGRSIASDSDSEKSRKKRIQMMKNFLAHEPVENQKAFATAMMNYMFDRSNGKPGDLTPAYDLLTGKIKTLNQISPLEPNNEVQRYISKAGAHSIDELKALTVYLLKAKNLKADPKKVVEFLTEQVKSGNSQFSVLQKNCVAGDPTIERLVASQN